MTALADDAAKRGITVSTLVKEIIDLHYSLNTPNDLTEAEIEEKVFLELADFVASAASGTEFDINAASHTYGMINMTSCGTKPSIIKARLGKLFAKSIGNTPFENVEVVRLKNGKIKRTTANRAAIYRIK